MTIGALVFVFGAALVATTLFMPAARLIAVRLGAVDRPGKRRVHTGTIPRMGGIAVYIGVLAGLLAGLAWCTDSSVQAIEAYLAIVLASTGVIVLGCFDDVRGLKPLTKLLAEAVLAIILCGAGLRIERIELPLGGAIELAGAVSAIATVLWIVAVTNAFNLIDGVNGLAGGVAAITAFGLMTMGLVAGAPIVVLLAAALAGALLAFLRHNLRPRGIFLGDSGSLYLGFVLAAATVHLGQTAGRPVFPGAALLLMGLPLIEIATTVVRRALRSRVLRVGPAGAVRFLKRELMRPDLGHLHHCLIQRGMKAGWTAALLLGAAAVYCLASVGLFAVPGAAAPAWLAAAVMTFVCLEVCRPFARSRFGPFAVRKPDLQVVIGGALASGAFPHQEVTAAAETTDEGDRLAA